jgi:hypothetical protein
MHWFGELRHCPDTGGAPTSSSSSSSRGHHISGATSGGRRHSLQKGEGDPLNGDTTGENAAGDDALRSHQRLKGRPNQLLPDSCHKGFARHRQIQQQQQPPQCFIRQSEAGALAST